METHHREQGAQSLFVSSAFPILTGSAPQKIGAVYLEFYLLYFFVVFDPVLCSPVWF